MLKKSFNIGLGLFAYSREKIEKIVDELVTKGEVSRKDAQGFVSDLVKKGEEQRGELKKIVKEEIKDSLKLNTLAKKDDLREIIREELMNVINNEGLTTYFSCDGLDYRLMNVTNNERLAKKDDINSIEKKLDSKQ